MTIRASSAAGCVRLEQSRHRAPTATHDEMVAPCPQGIPKWLRTLVDRGNGNVGLSLTRWRVCKRGLDDGQPLGEVVDARGDRLDPAAPDDDKIGHPKVGS